MKKHFIRLGLGLLLAGMALTSTGCQAKRSISQPPQLAMAEEQPTQNNCRLSENTNVQRAVGEAKMDLANDQCRPFFDTYLEGLMTIAAGNPSLTYKKDFSDLLVWASEQGIITTLQAKDYYNRYFSITFMSLPSEYNVCSECNAKDSIEQNLITELQQKEQGMKASCGDTTSYFEARNQHESVLLFLDAACEACKIDG